jgi:ATP-binding cassette subfamily B protein
MDCGPACLKMIAKHYGKTLSMKYLRDKCFITREGVSMFDIGQAAENIGLRTLALKLTFEDLRDKMPLPLIAHWKDKHFLVVYKITNKKVYVSDPAAGLLNYTHKEFCDAWYKDANLGAALLIETTPDFDAVLDVETSSSLKYFRRYLKPYHKYLFQVIIGMLVGILIGIMSPFISQSVVDFGITGGNMGFIKTMMVAGIVLAFSSLFSGFIQSRLMLYVSERINMNMVSDFLRKSLKLPISFFERKTISDLLTRIGDQSRIQSFIMSTFLGIFINVLLLIIYTCLMLYYESNMFFVFLIGNLIYTGWIFLFLRRRKKLDNMLFEIRATNQNAMLEILNSVQDIKANGIANSRRWRWELSRFKIYGLDVKNMDLDQIESAGASLILKLQGVVITYIAASNVINGSMTLGMMMAAQYILGQLAGPLGSMIGYVHSYQFAQLSLKRVNEVILDEKPEGSKADNDVPGKKTIKLTDVCFHYNPNFENVLKNITITIPENKITAIVGESGSGKTTLIKLLLRFYDPVSGNIEVGDTQIENIDLDKWRRSCGVVLQDGRLFNETILYNITLQDDEKEIDMDRLKSAVLLANLGDFINDRPLKIYTMLGENGLGLSQGQKQRILIARAIYKNPDFIFLDEATNSLDANNEKIISENLNHIMQGKTAVVIAHRLSTVRNAHNIIVLDKGSVVEQGIHDELIAKKGMYYRLVFNQLELGN